MLELLNVKLLKPPLLNPCARVANSDRPSKGKNCSVTLGEKSVSLRLRRRSKVSMPSAAQITPGSKQRFRRGACLSSSVDRPPRLSVQRSSKCHDALPNSP